MIKNARRRARDIYEQLVRRLFAMASSCVLILHLVTQQLAVMTPIQNNEQVQAVMQICLHQVRRRDCALTNLRDSLFGSGARSQTGVILLRNKFWNKAAKFLEQALALVRASLRHHFLLFAIG